MQVEQALVSLQGDRPENQDRARVFTLGNDYFAVLCDGLGGYPHGGEAAELFSEGFEQAVIQSPLYHQTDPHQTLLAWIACAQSTLSKRCLALGFSSEARTTCVCAWINEHLITIAHVGDSRAYAMDSTHVIWRTRDHSLFELSVMAGDLDDDPDARPRGQHKLLYRSVQTQKPPKPTVTSYPALAPGQTLLLCSDGAWYPLNDDALPTLYQHPNLQQGVAYLLENSLQRAAPRADNATAIAFRRY